MIEIDDLYEINRCLEILKNKIESDHNAIERVREIHSETKWNQCAHCSEWYEDWPCPTIKALDGEQ